MGAGTAYSRCAPPNALKMSGQRSGLEVRSPEALVGPVVPNGLKPSGERGRAKEVSPRSRNIR